MSSLVAAANAATDAGAGVSLLGGARKRLDGLTSQRGKKLVSSAPLPRLVKARVNRGAAYESTSASVTEWQATVKKNRGRVSFD